MSQISYQELQESNSNRSNNIGYFALKNDGDEALVRFMIDEPADYDILTVHILSVKGRNTAVNCIREPEEPIEHCPLCQAGAKLTNKFYIHLIEYVKQQDGTIKAFPKIWDRPYYYINKINNMVKEYAPLSDNLFKIKRNGAAGSKETTYDIMFADPNRYSSSTYIKDTLAFKDVKALGTVLRKLDFQGTLKLLQDNSTSQTQPVIQPQQAQAVQPQYNNPHQVNSAVTPNFENIQPQANVQMHANEQYAPKPIPQEAAPQNPGILSADLQNQFNAAPTASVVRQPYNGVSYSSNPAYEANSVESQGDLRPRRL